ncbi:MAG TPA: hypothetical protein VFH99_02685 [Candidatus Saccharimonadales bacterium]|nr:hypothetical protein [Candidatus Saccharimonadales bacterium]
MADGANRAAELLQQAYASGELSEESSQALIAAGDVGREVGYALGGGGHGDELLLVTILADDSGSISVIPGGAEAVRQGHNHCLDALDTEQGAEALVHTRYLNAGSLSPYRGLATATRLSAENFNPVAGHTPLYRQSVLTLGAVMAKVQEQKAEGRLVRAFTLIITDGGDNASGQVSAQHVNFLVRDMLDFSDDYIVAGMGIGQRATFQPIFRAMGIPEGWILTADALPEEISKLFRKIAQSLQLAASGEAGWLQLEAGPP